MAQGDCKIAVPAIVMEPAEVVFMSKKKNGKCFRLVLKGPVLRTACGPETGPNWTETDRTFGPGPCF